MSSGLGVGQEIKDGREAMVGGRVASAESPRLCLSPHTVYLASHLPEALHLAGYTGNLPRL